MKKTEVVEWIDISDLDYELGQDEERNHYAEEQNDDQQISEDQNTAPQQAQEQVDDHHVNHEVEQGQVGDQDENYPVEQEQADHQDNHLVSDRDIATKTRHADTEDAVDGCDITTIKLPPKIARRGRPKGTEKEKE